LTVLTPLNFKGVLLTEVDVPAPGHGAGQFGQLGRRRTGDHELNGPLFTNAGGPDERVGIWKISSGGVSLLNIGRTEYFARH
jgi:hypothetical protein